LVSILDLDIVILLVVFEESLVGVLDVVLGRLLHVDGVDSVDSVVTVISENRAADDLLLKELLNIYPLPSVSSAFPGLIEQLLHLVVHGIISQNSARKIDQHLHFHTVINIYGGLVTGPDVQVGLADLMLVV